MLGPEASAPILNLLHCCTRSEPSTDGIKNIEEAVNVTGELHKSDPDLDSNCAFGYLELRGRPGRMPQVADLGAVPAQASMNAAALVTNQHTPVH